LKKTIEKQRTEINGIKERLQVADQNTREAEIAREAALL
jgi:hypothetical protein